MDPVFPFAIVLPGRGEGALAHELHQQLRAAILDGRLAAGSQLPATRRVAAVTAKARRHAPGMQPISDYSLAPPERPALVFGYGAIEANEIRATTQRLRRALQNS